MVIGWRQLSDDDGTGDKDDSVANIRGRPLLRIDPPDPPDPPLQNDLAERYGIVLERVMAEKLQTTGQNTSTKIAVVKSVPHKTKTKTALAEIQIDWDCLQQQQPIHWEPPGSQRPEQEAAYIE